MSAKGGEDPNREQTGDPASEAPSLTLEARLRRLDEIVAALEGGSADLERGLLLFEEGVRHIREAERLLATAELRVDELVGGAGTGELRPLEGAED